MCDYDPPSLSVVLAGSAGLAAMFRLSIVLITAASHGDKRQDKKKRKRRTLPKSEMETAVTEATSLLLEENGDDGNDGRDDVRLGAVGTARLYHVSFLSHLVLSVIFFVGAWRSATMSLVLRYATIAVALHACAQGVDPVRGLFSAGQRGLYAVSCLCLFEAGVFMMVLKGGDGSCFDAFDVVMLFSMCVYWPVLVCLEIWLSPQPPKDDSGGSDPLSVGALSTLLWPYVWPDGALNRFLVVTTWVCVVGARVCNLVSPVLLGRASTALTQADYGQTIWLSTQYALLICASKFFKEGQSLAYLKVAKAAFVSLSSATFRHLHGLSLDWHLKKRLGTVLRSMDRGIGACDTLMKYVCLWLFPVLAEAVLVCVIFAVYFQYKPLSVAVFIFVFCYCVLTIVLTLWRKKFRKAVASSDNKWHDVCTDSLINFETVKYFTAEEYETAKFDHAVSSFQTGTVHVQASLSALNLAQQIVYNACLAVSLALTAMAVQGRSDCCAAHVPGGCDELSCCGAVSKITCPGMDVGDFVTVLTYLVNLFQPLNFLGSRYNAIVMALVDLTNLSELMAEKPTVTDAMGCVHLPFYNGQDEDVAVEFEDVYFHYPTQASNSGLKGVDFVMKRGETTAVVGSTGAGKTTISRLFFRFYDVLHGSVKVNGIDIRSVTQQSLRDAVGFVPQTTELFNDTIRNNILYGRRDATQYDLDRVVEDARLSGFIASLPQGWDTMVGDRGLKLSGGEKQRVAIARCLLKDPPVVVLDEATSALDTITENSVQLALDRLGKDRTCLVIAHRLGTVRGADNIIVLDDGVVAEQGTHDELLAAEGLYADMWNMQLHSGTGSSGSLTALKAEAEAIMVVTKGDDIDDDKDKTSVAAAKE